MLARRSCYPYKVPLARIIVLALALTHAVGLTEQVMRATCEQLCRDDGCGDDCTPCEPSACRCHGSATTPLLDITNQVIAKVETPIAVAPCERTRRAHASPDPREILHVPRHAV